MRELLGKHPHRAPQAPLSSHWARTRPDAQGGRAGQGRGICRLRLPCPAQPVCSDLGGWKAAPTPPPPPCSQEDNGGLWFMFCGCQLGEHAADFVLEVLGGGSEGSPPPAWLSPHMETLKGAGAGSLCGGGCWDSVGTHCWGLGVGGSPLPSPSLPSGALDSHPGAWASWCQGLQCPWGDMRGNSLLRQRPARGGHSRMAP